MSLVSIIIPCYNQANFLEESLQSVLEQNYKDWECIIVNDGSIDNTEDVAKKWIDKDKRFKYFFKQNGGLSSARNYGVSKSNGDFIQFLDSDDLLNSEKLDLSIQKVNFNSEYSVVISNFKMFEDDISKAQHPYCKLFLELFELDSILNKWDFDFSIPIHCGFFSRKIFDTCTFDEDLKAKEDWHFWIQLFHKKLNVNFIDLPLAFYRMHPNSMTKSPAIMIENHSRVLNKIKEITTPEEYENLLLNRSIQYYNKVNNLNLKIVQLKNSNSYLGGLFFKKIISKLGMLSFSRSIFKIIIKKFKK
ncbi:MAG: glycosyltransferase [Limnohabitans sp.]|nr:glycosyltransferase [Limnohabitans sp.]